MRILIAVALGAVLLVGVFAGYTELVERVVYDESVFAIAALVGVFAVLALAAILFVVDKNKKRLNAKELEIKYREQLFGMLVDNTDDIYIMFSPEGFAVEYVSPNIEKLLGVSADDVRHDIRALVDSAVDPSCDPAAEDIECLGEGECLQIDRERIRKNTGERRWYQETLYRESINGVDKYILVLSDRTREGMNSARLEQALAIARSSNEAKSLFLANMSHDIRTPINAIVGMARITQESGEASKRVETCLHTIMLSSQHLLNLINDVLEMSRIESGQMSLQEERCTLDAIVEGVEAIIRPQAQAEPVFYDALNSRVALLKLIPGASAGQLRFLLDENDAVILESFGVGGVPSGETGEFYEVIRKASAKGKTVVVTTQVQNEGSDLSIYNVGHSLKNSLGVLEAFDMTTEAVVAKLMWLLALTDDPNEVQKLFYTPVANDILRGAGI